MVRERYIHAIDPIEDRAAGIAKDLRKWGLTQSVRIYRRSISVPGELNAQVYVVVCDRPKR